MEIKTKYSVGDVVWYMSENKCTFQSITSVHTTSTSDNTGGVKTEALYNIQFCSMAFQEKNLYQTKEELIKSL